MDRKYWFARDDLREYPQLKAALETLPERIRQIEGEMTSLKSSMQGGEPVKGGGREADRRLANLIYTKARLEKRLASAAADVITIERCMSVLTAQEKRVLEVFFIDNAKYAADRLCEELGYERSRVYQLRDTALEKYERAAIG